MLLAFWHSCKPISLLSTWFVRQMADRPRKLLWCGALLLVAGAQAAADAQVGGVNQPLLGAARDVDSPQANATVLLTGAQGQRCTGTLIAPRVVISAAHCGFMRPSGPTWRPVVWHRAPAGLVASFGPDAANFRDQISISYVSIPGNRDLILLGLDRPPLPSVAIPARILLDSNLGARRVSWNQQTFTAVGWGGRDPNDHQNNQAPFRETVAARGMAQSCADWPGALCVRSIRGGSQTRGGDSGGPLYWTDRRGQTWLVGVLQGYGTGDRYHATWYRHPLAWDSNGPNPGRRVGVDQRDWIARAAELSWCGSLKASADEGARSRLLHHWYHPGTGDNRATSDPLWAGCPGDVLRGYRFVGVMGRVAAPQESRPRDALALHGWWSPSRGDYITTTDGNWAGRAGQTREPDYVWQRLEGFVIAPGTRVSASMPALVSWWSERRRDHFLTADPAWTRAAGGDRSLDYRFIRAEGFLYPNPEWN
jgi:hypothetical protein